MDYYPSQTTDSDSYKLVGPFDALDRPYIGNSALIDNLRETS